jgi:hypothetical protein
LTNYLLSIDPGWSTGVALLKYYNDTPATLVKAWQFSGGLMGLREWMNRTWRESGWDDYNDEPEYAGLKVRGLGLPLTLYSEGFYRYDSEVEDDVWVNPNLKVIAEKFTPRPNEKFGLTLRSVEPLRCEGVLVDRGLLPDYDPKVKEWRQPKDQYIVGGKDLTDKKKRQHAFLKDSGFYVTNKMFPDSPPKDQADDARSAIAHGLGYITRVIKHEPTFQVLSDWSERG